MIQKTRFIELEGESPWTHRRLMTWPTASDDYVYTRGVGSPVLGKQILHTENNGWPRTKQGTRDVGGNFFTSKVQTYVHSQSGVYTTRELYGHQYTGQFWPVGPHGAVEKALAAVNPLSNMGLDALGATAVSRCMPTSPVVDGTTAIGELITGLPKIPAKMLLKTKFKESREYGSEFLNIQFGWLPLVSDLQKLARAVTESDKILSQMRRDSGRLIRRRYQFPLETSSSTVNDSRNSYGSYAGQVQESALMRPGRLRTITKDSVSTWFSGAFTYHVDLGKDFPSKMNRFAQEARRLYGVELTPEVVWNLTPFSWLTDWYANTGDVLSNISRFSQDGLVMPYGYVMQKREHSVSYELIGGGPDTGHPYTPSWSLSIRTESKVRRRANPFGFGVTNDTLTGRQGAILAALGIAQRRS